MQIFCELKRYVEYIHVIYNMYFISIGIRKPAGNAGHREARVELTFFASNVIYISLIVLHESTKSLITSN